MNEMRLYCLQPMMIHLPFCRRLAACMQIVCPVYLPLQYLSINGRTLLENLDLVVCTDHDQLKQFEACPFSADVLEEEHLLHADRNEQTPYRKSGH